MKINNKYLPIYFCVTLALGVILGSVLSFSNQNQFFAKNNSKNKLNRLIDFINNEYVDSVNTDSIVNLTVDNILAKLDPHSVYIPPTEQAEVVESMKGDFVGIGVNFYMYNDSVAIIKTVENGPSAKAGVKAGDRILYADKTKLFGRKLPNDSLFSKLKGSIGSVIELTVYRKSEGKKIKVKIKRDVIPLKSVDVSMLLKNNTGYIKINRFAETTYNEFAAGLLSLKKQGARSLIIDVRDNGGGYMEEAIAIADELLKDKQLIVFTKNKKGTIEKTFATKLGSFETGNVYVLINENSASASEILAGAIQDNDRGTIVGRRSFGKGLVQREMDFEDGSAVRLTIARYYTPTGRSIQKPYSKGNEDYFKESDARFQNGELYSKDSIKVSDTLKFKTKKGKIVYGGGGIVPDVFVPLEVEHGSESTAYLLESGIVGHFVFEQLDANRNIFKGLTFQQFKAKMDATDVYFNSFQKYIFQNGLDLKFGKSKSFVKRYITAEFARQLYGENYYYEIVLKEDAMIKAILK
ncbi:carboxyl-terminal processing protease [Flavobacterium sp. CG_23.5]|uniref:S41 family peptidase n=1 Tax=unclassified Flavobacterium TaxID=196869 RepID=UPI0018C9D87C|nr:MULTISPECIES: S41 family peptidase [unclassified Flavobacterium]MBG6110615.1 carboxyl-terminal processing protease [Flavobacterium sp. CG_9.10]MBP2283964.1 carboxyl-terminal processing protease [Flavobacterium sp. CG_23.5]